MDTNAYLIKQLEARTEELREEIQSKPLSLTTAYAQGKLDAYRFVLVALKENEEVKDNG